MNDHHRLSADPPAAHSELDALRAELDAIDGALLDEVRARLEVCRRVAELKQRHDLAVLQPDRMAMVHSRARDYAHRHGMSPEFVQALYTLLIDEACRVEDRIVSGVDAGHRQS